MENLATQNAVAGRFTEISLPQWSMLALMLALSSVVFATYDQYGFTTDEDRGLVRAERIFAVLSSGRVTESSEIDLFHGAAPDVIALMLQKLVPTLSYDSRHLVFALFGIAGVYFVYRFGSRWVSEWAGFFAALFLATTPMWFGYMFINHKDIPFATLLLASTHYSLIALTSDSISPRLGFKAGAAIGLLAGTKFVGLLLLPLVVALFVGCLFLSGQASFDAPRDLARRIAKLTGVAVLGTVAGFILFFPQLFFGEINQSGASTRFSEIHKWTRSRGNDSFYGIRHFIVTTPIFLLVLAAAGLIFAIRRRQATVLAASLLCGFVFLAPMVSHNRLYDGCRHFLFAYPYFMIVAAYPLSVLLAVNSVAVRAAVSCAVALCLAGPVWEMYRLFPYQYSFYNAFVGGIEGADGVYEMDMWRSAHREALKLIASRVSPGETVRVFSCGSRIDYRRYEGLILTKVMDEADYFVTSRRGRGCSATRFEGRPLIDDVRRGTVIFARIYAAR